MTFKNPPVQDKPVMVIDAENWFGNKAFAHKGVIYRIEDIVGITSNNGSISINFVPISHYCEFSLILSNGNILRFGANSSIVKTKKVKNLSEVSDFISKITFDQRAYPYLQKIQTNGFFQYHDYFIYDNGDIKYKSNTINIAEAGLQNNVEFGTEREFISSYSTPNEITVSQKIPGNFFKKSICIKIKENRDVIYAILFKLSKLKMPK